MVGEVFAGISAFNGLLNAAKALREMDNAMVRNSAVIDLQGKILAAQEEYADMLGKVRELETKLAAFENWETEKQRYELKDHGENAVLAYALKAGVEPPEQPHSICPDCYQQRKRSILQTETRYHNGQSICLSCQACGWRGWIWGNALSLGDKRR
jgi:hypothetical protein